jgi:hypothetical protein
LIASFGSSECPFASRVDNKSKEFISLRDDDSHLEWRVTKFHVDPASCSASISSWTTSEMFNVSIFRTIPDGSPILGKFQVEALESVCASFLIGKPIGNLCASAWTTTDSDLVDLLKATNRVMSETGRHDELVPETESVRLNSALDFQRFVRRLEHSLDNVSCLFVRFVLFGRNQIIHFIFIHNRDAIKALSGIPQARMARKGGSPCVTITSSLTERCLIPLLAGNAKPFIVLDGTDANDFNAVSFQTLLDLGEKMCITALPCEPEVELRMDDFEIIDSIDKLPPRRQSVSSKGERPKSSPSRRVSVHVSDPLPKPLSDETLLQEISQLENELASGAEIDELKAKNLTLKCEVDRLKSSVDTGNSSAYTNHLVAEVKQLRQELLKVETEKRKYETSKRLVESLIEKTNKLKADCTSKTSKIEEMRKHESLLKAELGELKRNCEALLQDNRQLNLELESVKTSNSSSESRTRTPQVSVDSFYHEFLFPFNRKRETGKALASLHETLQKIERCVAINAPACVLDVRRCISQSERIRDFFNELVSASEKLEVSAITLIKKYAGTKS